MSHESDLPLPLTCTVSRVLRALYVWDQQTVSNVLELDPKALSAIERGTKGDRISREEIEEYVVKLGRPIGAVDEIFASVLRIAGMSGPQPKGLETDLRRLADRVGASYGQQFYESSIAASREMVVATEREIAASLWRHFSALSSAARRPAVESERMFALWAFAERLWRESLNAAPDDAGRALELAERALIVARRCEGDPNFLRRLEGLALSAVANARRVGGELLLADRHFARAKELWESGAAADPGILDEACFLALEATLRISQRRFPEALVCIEAAFEAALPGSDVVYLLISRGKILIEMGQHEAAAEAYREATARMGPSTSLREGLVARFNLTLCLLELHRAAEARERLPELRRNAVELGNGLDLLRVKWLEGKVQAGLLEREEAVVTLRDVRDAFLARGILFDAALVALEAAALQLESGEGAEVRSEALELAEAFQHLGVVPELLASVQLFWAAAQAEKATAEQARLILAQLRRAGSEPVSAV